MIHYRGQLDDRAVLAELLDTARDFCAAQGWGSLEVQEDIRGTVERVTDEKVCSASVADSVRGMVIYPHPLCDPLWLTFNQAGELCNYLPLNDSGEYLERKTFSMDTRRVPFEIHAAVCDLLRLLQSAHMPRLFVFDESGYFESGDTAFREPESEEAIGQAEADTVVPFEG